jgi:hypothetical protein
VDTSSLAAGATVSSVILTIKEDPSANSANASGADGKIKAFPVTASWDDGIRAGSYADKPATASDPAIPGKRGGDGTWTFDITPVVSAWLDGTLSNNGIALRPTDLSAADNFSVIYGSGAAAEGDVTTPTTDTTGGSTSTDLGSTTATAPGSSGDTTGSSNSGGASFSSPVTPSDSSGGTSTATNSPAATAAPTTLPSTPAQNAAGSAAAKHRGKPGINAGFVLAGLGLLALVGAAAFVLGDAGEPVPPRAGSVLRALDRRAAATRGLTEAKEH